MLENVFSLLTCRYKNMTEMENEIGVVNFQIFFLILNSIFQNSTNIFVDFSFFDLRIGKKV